MKVTGATIQQLDKGADGRKPKGKCRKWRLWATTEQGRKSRVFNGTFTGAQEALEAFVRELSGIVPCEETFGAYAASWQAWRASSGDLTPNGKAKDARNVKALRRTALDGMCMDEIGPEQCREALLWLKNHPVKGSGELSQATMAGIHTALHTILAQAAGDGKIASNPMERVKRPKVGETSREALSPEELQLLLNRVDGLPLDGRVMAVYLMACLGLRRGEALALRDDDVSGGLARVHLAVKEANGEVGPPKSPAGVRTLPVPPRLQAKVDEWRTERERIGLAGAPELACNAFGGTMRPQNLYKWWRKTSSKLGCEGMVLHELRHSNLSMMARHMSPFDLQRYAGWSSIGPARIYVHDDLEAVARGVSRAWAACAPRVHPNPRQSFAECNETPAEQEKQDSSTS